LLIGRRFRDNATVRRKATSLLILFGLLMSSALALGAPRDKAAQKKIEEAIYTNFLNTDFDGAEGLLLGTIRACEDKCSPELVAKAWMYVGVVRGSGRNDQPGAQEAFTTAMSIDPNVALDNEIATDPVKATFAKVKGGAVVAGGETSAPAGGGGFTCAPAPTEIETRRPFPLQCEADDKVAAVKLHYKAPSVGWASVKMTLQEGSFRATIPCSATQSTGGLKYYAEGLDGDGEPIVSYGSKDNPKQADVVSETTADPPAYPDQQPPARCAVGEPGAAPPPSGTGACGGMDAPCGADDCCEEGLSCNSGVCEREDTKKKAHGYPKNWVGLHFGLDLATVSSDGACDLKARNNDNWVCFYPNDQSYQGTPSLGAMGKIDGGLAVATMRVMASYERLFGPLGLEGRVGFAFNGGPTPLNGSAFLPVHLEGRAKYYLRGPKAFSEPGFRPWIHLGGGMAQIDTKVEVDIVDCSTPDKGGTTPPQFAADCRAAATSTLARANRGSLQHLTAVKQLGRGFGTVGGGVMYAIAPNHGPVLSVNLMVPFPAVSFVIEPSLGYAFGF
jgi:hypothetical protein